MWLNVIKAIGTVCISIISLVGVYDLFSRNKKTVDYKDSSIKRGGGSKRRYY